MKTWQAGREISILQDIKNGTKTVEGRLNRDQYKQYRVGDRVSLRADVYDDSGNVIKRIPNQALIEILKIEHFVSIKQMLLGVGYQVCTPRATSLEDAESIYGRFYSPEEEQKHGVLAIHFKLIH